MTPLVDASSVVLRRGGMVLEFRAVFSFCDEVGFVRSNGRTVGPGAGPGNRREMNVLWELSSTIFSAPLIADFNGGVVSRRLRKSQSPRRNNEANAIAPTTLPTMIPTLDLLPLLLAVCGLAEDCGGYIEKVVAPMVVDELADVVDELLINSNVCWRLSSCRREYCTCSSRLLELDYLPPEDQSLLRYTSLVSTMNSRSASEYLLRVVLVRLNYVRTVLVSANCYLSDLQ